MKLEDEIIKVATDMMNVANKIRSMESKHNSFARRSVKNNPEYKKYKEVALGIMEFDHSYPPMSSGQIYDRLLECGFDYVNKYYLGKLLNEDFSDFQCKSGNKRMYYCKCIMD